MKNQKIRNLTVTAVMGAIGAALMFIEIPLPFMPNFIKFDFSELPAILTSFALGPIHGIVVCLLKNLLHLPFGSSAGIGEISNFILGAVFTGIAGIIYKYSKTRKGALIASISGSFSMAVISVAANYFIVYPLYQKVLGMPEEAILGMYRAIMPSCKNLIEALAVFNLPFTLVKGLLVSGICFAVYKKLSVIIKGKKETVCE